MVLFGLSTHLFANRPLSARHLDLIRGAGFSRVEIWAMPPHLDYRNAGVMRALAGTVRDLGLQVVSFHGPFYLSFAENPFFNASLGDPNKVWRRRLVDEMKALADAMPAFGADALVVHGLGETEVEEDPQHAKALLRESLAELGPFVEARGIRLAVENIHTHYSRTVSLRKEIEKVGHPAVGICLDVAHANLNENPEKAVENCGSRLFHLHLSDNQGHEDEHRLPFDGNIRWPAVCAALARRRKLKYAILELLFPQPEDNLNVGMARELLARAKERVDRLERDLDRAAEGSKGR